MRGLLGKSAELSSQKLPRGDRDDSFFLVVAACGCAITGFPLPVLRCRPTSAAAAAAAAEHNQQLRFLAYQYGRLRFYYQSTTQLSSSSCLLVASIKKSWSSPPPLLFLIERVEKRYWYGATSSLLGFDLFLRVDDASV